LNGTCGRAKQWGNGFGSREGKKMSPHHHIRTSCKSKASHQTTAYNGSVPNSRHLDIKLPPFLFSSKVMYV
jgi:hypothetical protein